MPTAIYDAWAAIEQRRPSLIATDGTEERANGERSNRTSHAQGRANGETKMFQSALELLVQDNGQKGLIDLSSSVALDET
jgi:hypothetical protein